MDPALFQAAVRFPYTLGFLLAEYLTSRFRQEGAAFLSRYEEFLKAAGSGTVEDVAARVLGADATRKDFWADALAGLKEPVERFRRMVDAAAAERPFNGGRR